MPSLQDVRFLARRGLIGHCRDIRAIKGILQVVILSITINAYTIAIVVFKLPILVMTLIAKTKQRYL